jgi:hypothetical protein
VIAHLDEAGPPTVSVFENAVPRIPPGRARLLVRHQAAAPPVEGLNGRGAGPKAGPSLAMPYR